MRLNKQELVKTISIKFRELKICYNVKATLPGALSDVLYGLCINNDRIGDCCGFLGGLVFCFCFFERSGRKISQTMNTLVKALSLLSQCQSFLALHTICCVSPFNFCSLSCCDKINLTHITYTGLCSSYTQ